MLTQVVVSDPEIMNGTPCFQGTRVPFKNLIDYVEGGQSLGEFLQQFPSVSREKAVQALEQAKESLLAQIARKYCWTSAYQWIFGTIFPATKYTALSGLDSRD